MSTKTFMLNKDYKPTRHLMMERGNVKDLNELGEKFLAFAQRSNNYVQSWELLDNRLNSLYGATLKVPMRNWSDLSAEEKYFFLFTSIMQKASGNTDDNIVDTLKNRYNKCTYMEDYTMTSLDDILAKLPTLSVDSISHVAINGCEANLLAGDSAKIVVDKLKSIMSAVTNKDAKPTLFITPTDNLYSNQTALDEYAILRRSSYISKKVNIVFIGDTLIAPYAGYTWVDDCASNVPNCYIINKGTVNNTIANASQRFTADVVNQLADACFITVGYNEMFTLTSAQRNTIKLDYEQIITDCIANNIVPIIGLFNPTKEQITQYISDYSVQGANTVAQIKIDFKDFNVFCCQMADKYGLKTIDVTNIALDKNKKPISAYFNDNSSILSEQGRQIVGASVAKKLNEIAMDIHNKFDYSFDIINTYDIYCELLNKDSLTQTDLRKVLDASHQHYSGEDAFNAVTDYVLANNWLLPFNAPCFYVSLSHINVTSSTYPNWLRTGNMLEAGEELAYGQGKQINEYADWHTQVYYQSEKYNHSIETPGEVQHVLANQYGGQDRENAFRNTGEFVAIGLHTTFDDGIWMCEQGGITCEKEAKAQINDLNFLPLTRLHIPRKTGLKSYNTITHLPVFPNTGCPWFTISDKNKADYNTAIAGIDYWFTKSDYDATITIRVNKHHKTAIYQSMSFGLLESLSFESYVFPLYIAGGNQGISQHNESYNIYDLNIKNISLSNSNLLHPSRLNNANMSNFRVMSPEGEWKDIIAHIQKSVTEPSQFQGDTQTDYHSAVPFSDDWLSVVRSYYTGYTDIDNKYYASSPLNKVVIALNFNLPHQETGVKGVIPNCYYSWYDDLATGEITIDGRKYLSIPNGWEGRLLDYPASTVPAVGNMAENLEAMWSSIRTFTDRLIIPLEEGE